MVKSFSGQKDVGNPSRFRMAYIRLSLKIFLPFSYCSKRLLNNGSSSVWGGTQWPFRLVFSSNPYLILFSPSVSAGPLLAHQINLKL